MDKRTSRTGGITGGAGGKKVWHGKIGTLQKRRKEISSSSRNVEDKREHSWWIHRE